MVAINVSKVSVEKDPLYKKIINVFWSRKNIVSLFWIEKFILLLSLGQFLGLLMRTIIWPYYWRSIAGWLLLLNLDISRFNSRISVATFLGASNDTLDEILIACLVYGCTPWILLMIRELLIAKFFKSALKIRQMIWTLDVLEHFLFVIFLIPYTITLASSIKIFIPSSTVDENARPLAWMEEYVSFDGRTITPSSIFGTSVIHSGRHLPDHLNLGGWSFAAVLIVPLTMLPSLFLVLTKLFKLYLHAVRESVFLSSTRTVANVRRLEAEFSFGISNTWAESRLYLLSSFSGRPLSKFTWLYLHLLGVVLAFIAVLLEPYPRVSSILFFLLVSSIAPFALLGRPFRCLSSNCVLFIAGLLISLYSFFMVLRAYGARFQLVVDSFLVSALRGSGLAAAVLLFLPMFVALVLQAMQQSVLQGSLRYIYLVPVGLREFIYNQVLSCGWSPPLVLSVLQRERRSAERSRRLLRGRFVRQRRSSGIEQKEGETDIFDEPLERPRDTKEGDSDFDETDGGRDYYGASMRAAGVDVTQRERLMALLFPTQDGKDEFLQSPFHAFLDQQRAAMRGYLERARRPVPSLSIGHEHVRNIADSKWNVDLEKRHAASFRLFDHERKWEEVDDQDGVGERHGFGGDSVAVSIARATIGAYKGMDAHAGSSSHPVLAGSIQNPHLTSVNTNLRHNGVSAASRPGMRARYSSEKMVSKTDFRVRVGGVVRPAAMTIKEDSSVLDASEKGIEHGDSSVPDETLRRKVIVRRNIPAFAPENRGRSSDFGNVSGSFTLLGSLWVFLLGILRFVTCGRLSNTSKKHDVNLVRTSSVVEESDTIVLPIAAAELTAYPELKNGVVFGHISPQHSPLPISVQSESFSVGSDPDAFIVAVANGKPFQNPPSNSSVMSAIAQNENLAPQAPDVTSASVDPVGTVATLNISTAVPDRLLELQRLFPSDLLPLWALVELEMVWVARLQSFHQLLQQQLTLPLEMVDLASLHAHAHASQRQFAHALACRHLLALSFADVLDQAAALALRAADVSVRHHPGLQEGRLRALAVRMQRREVEYLLAGPLRARIVLKMLAVCAFVGNRRLPRVYIPGVNDSAFLRSSEAKARAKLKERAPFRPSEMKEADEPHSERPNGRTTSFSATLKKIPVQNSFMEVDSKSSDRDLWGKFGDNMSMNSPTGSLDRIDSLSDLGSLGSLLSSEDFDSHSPHASDRDDDDVETGFNTFNRKIVSSYKLSGKGNATFQKDVIPESVDNSEDWNKSIEWSSDEEIRQ